jgi:glycosyltransferase involved in cell wall biosynthesis
MKPKLLVLTSTFPRWSEDTDPPFVYELSRRLTDTFDVTVHAPHYPGAKTRETMGGMYIHRFRYSFAPFERLAGSTGILPTLHYNKLYYGLVPFFLLAQFFSLLFLVQKKRPEIIHAHWILPQGFVAVLVGILSGVPVVITAHGADVFGLQGVLLEKIKRFTLKRVKGVTVVSKALADVVSSFVPPDVHLQIIPMGVDSVVFSPEHKDDSIKKIYGVKGTLLIYVGRLTEKKGVAYLVEAMGMLCNDIPDGKLVIIGSGELEERLKKQVSALKLDNYIQFAGSITNKKLPAYYASADIFIGPSIEAKSGDKEGFGLTFVEAAMSGCLVIGTRVGGICDIIQDNETGFLIPAKEPDALAQKIIYALEHNHQVQSIRRTARKRFIEKFDQKIIAERYASLFLQVIDQ